MARLVDLNFKRKVNVFTQGNPERAWPHVLQTISNLDKETGMSTVPITATVTRPNDTAGYTAGDVIGTATGSTAAILFSGIGPTGGVIRITGSRLEIDVATIPSGLTSFRLHLYNATPSSALGDNAVWDLPSGDRPNYLGYVDLGSPVDVGSTLYVQQTGLDYDFVLASSDLYGYLVTNGTYTPTAQSVKKITLYAMSM
jgi:hypothetical protein